ncbi:hypothetical protein [Longitalea luteola]|uniref:hypothetical protein n=1 Tax=Longitalea luteola TaxID=2812563 RepID=UPI001A978672|nr:hypothetical protein [Longitalea luteola]
MRYLLVIAALLLFAGYSNLIQLSDLTEVATFMVCEEPESEEDNKSEKEFKKNKFDKHPHSYDCPFLLNFISSQIKYFHKSGLCLKGHCALIDQPPEL